MLTTIIFLPLVGAIIIALFCRAPHWVRRVATIIAAAEFGLSLIAILIFRNSDYNALEGTSFKLVERADWIKGVVPGFPVEYFVAVDGLSMPLVLLTSLLGLTAVLASWRVQHRLKAYFALLLVLQTAVTGVFASLDFVLFFIFWELELIPMYFLIALWGTGRSSYSAMKFLLFTALGSAFMLAAILLLFLSTGTFDMVALSGMSLTGLLVPAQLIFTFFFVAFAIKLPVWPVHTWLPDAHTDAPTAVSMMLAGVLLKMGGYGMIRVNAGMFPEITHAAAGVIVVLGTVNVIYGAMAVLRQTDLKRLIAYSSVSHMGFVLIGLSSLGATQGNLSLSGLSGAATQLFAHGTITALLFLLVGLIYERAHTRHVPDLGGLASQMPILSTSLLVAGLASLGLPGLSGFVAEILVFLGAFSVWPWPTAIATFGVVLTAGYILWMLQRSIFGPAKKRYRDLRDASPVDVIPIALLLLAVIIVGVYPAILVDIFNTGLEPIIGRFV